MTSTTEEQRLAPRGSTRVQFRIDAFADEGGGELIIEMAAYEAGPRGGKAAQLDLTPEYWDGLLRVLAERGVS